jgi:sugar/nucleoside kinase (ribokinase family)
MAKTGLFVGLITLDFIYLTDQHPQPNEKIVATDYLSCAGGPATNAAVTFSGLGNQAIWLGALGQHPITQLIYSDLNQFNLKIVDLVTDSPNSPPVSSIIVNFQTGDRTVISINAIKSQLSEKIDRELLDSLDNIDLVLIDGHQILISEQISQIARQKNIPVVLDGGSWKPGLEKVLPYIDYAICSAKFYPPDCHDQQQVFAYLSKFNIPHIAISAGEKPLEYYAQGELRQISIQPVKVLDTLGAGDILHGAFCHYLLENIQHDDYFSLALEKATQIASKSCQYFGPRQWLKT